MITTDIDECLEEDNICKMDPRGLCENELGSFKCSCVDGYTWDEEDEECKSKTQKETQDVDSKLV